MKKILCVFALCLFTAIVYAQVPSWSVNPTAFENTMTVKGIVKIDHEEIRSDGGLIAAFVGGQVRGVNSLVYSPSLDRYFAFFLIYGSSGEDITFKYYDESSDAVFDLLNDLEFEVDGDAGSFEDPILLKNVDGEAEITAFSFDHLSSTRTQILGNNITVYVPENEDISALTASFSLSDGAIALVNSTTQNSGVTTNDFSSEVVYTIVSSDLDTLTWTIDVEKAGAEVSSFSFDGVANSVVNIDEGTKTILVNVPEAVDLSNLVANFTLSTGAVARVGGNLQTSGVSTNNFSSDVTYEVQSQANELIEWTVTVQKGSAEILTFDFPAISNSTVSIDNAAKTIKVFVAESQDITAVVPTFTLSAGADAFIASALQASGFSTVDFTNEVSYEIESSAGDRQTWTIEVEKTSSVFQTFNMPAVIPSSVQIDEANRTIQVYVPEATDLSALTPTFTLSNSGVTSVSAVTQTSGTSAQNFSSTVTYEVTSLAGETLSWDVTVSPVDAAFTSFDIAGVNYSDVTINAVAQTVTVYISEELNINALKAAFTLSDQATAQVSTVNQTSNVTENDFSSAVTYALTSLAGEVKNWTVTVTEAQSAIVAYAFDGLASSSVVLDEDAQEILLYVPEGTDVTSLVADFTLSAGASATVGGNVQTSAVTANNFTNPLTYDIASLAGEVQNWTITVIEAGAAIETFDIVAANYSDVTVNATTQTITVFISEELNPNALKASFTLSDGATAEVSGVSQTSNVTENDFSGTLFYKVTSLAGEVATWSVTVTPSGTEFISFLFDGVTTSDITIDQGNNTILAYVPEEVDITALKALFALSGGASAEVGGNVQIAGVSENDYSTTVNYVVNSLAGESQLWDVTVVAVGADVKSFDIAAATFSDVTIDEGAKTVTVYISEELNINALRPSFSLSDGAVATVDGISQTSNVTENDFSNILNYRVTSLAGEVENWQVSVTETGTDILDYELDGVTISKVEINESLNEILIYVAEENAINALTASFTLSNGASAQIGATNQVSGVTSNDFSSPVLYEVSSLAGAQTEWEVTVEQAGAVIEGFDIDAANFSSVSIDNVAQAVTVYISDELNINALRASFTLSDGAVASVGGVTQSSNVTENDFSRTATYQVVSLADEEKRWTVDVVETGVEILSYSLDGVSVADVNLDAANHEILIYVPEETDIENLTASFSLSNGATATVGGNAQVSGTTVNDFRTARTYSVKSLAGEEQDWIVTIEPVGAQIETFDITAANYANVIIDENTQRITAYISEELNINALRAAFTVSDGAVARIGSVTQLSSVSENDYSNTVTYQVASLAGEVKNWQVDVIETGTDILSYDVQGVSVSDVSINSTNHEILVYVPEETDIANVVASFVLSNGASASVGGNGQVSGVSSNDFSNAVLYDINALSGEQEQWEVTILPVGAAITAYDIGAANFSEVTVDDDARTISVFVSDELNINALVASFSLSSGAVATVNGVNQQSNVTENSFSSKVTYRVESLAGEVQLWDVFISQNGSDILSFQLQGVSVSNVQIDPINYSILAYIPESIDLDNLVPSFVLSGGATAKVGGLAQVSGTTTNDFTNPLTYTISSLAGEAIDWEITVLQAGAQVTTFDISGITYSAVTIDEVNEEITVYIPEGLDLKSLRADFTISAGAVASVSGVTQSSRVSANDFSSTVNYRVTSLAGEVKNWQVSVTETGVEILAYALDDVGISDITIDQSDQTVLIYVPEETDITNLTASFELSTGAGAAVSAVPQVSGATTNDFTGTLTYDVASLAGEQKVWEVTLIPVGANITTYDIEAAAFSNVTIDDANEEITVYISEELNLKALKAAFTISDGADVFVGSTEQTSNLTENDFSSALTYSVTSLAGETKDWEVTIEETGAEILSFGLGSVSISDVTLDVDAQTILIYVPEATDVTDLAASFILSNGGSAMVNSAAQSSGTTTNDFTNPVTYAVTSLAGEQKDWEVTITPVGAAITAFDIQAAEFSSVTIDADAQTILTYVSEEVSVRSLIASFSLSSGAEATVSGTDQQSNSTQNDFSSTLDYEVTSLAGETLTWEVTVVSTGANIEAFELNGVAYADLSLDADAQEIVAYVNEETDVANLVAGFALSNAATATVSGVTQTNDVTTNDFTSAQEYVVTSSAGEVKNWTVKVIPVGVEFTDFVVPDALYADITIDETSSTITAYVSEEVNPVDLVTEFTLSNGAVATVKTIAQVSGVSENDFSEEVTYLISALSGETQEWTVNLILTGAQILDFSFPDVDFANAVIDDTNQSVTIYVNAETDVTALTASFELSNGGKAAVGTAVQESGVTVNDFSDELTYEVSSLAGENLSWAIDVIPVGVEMESFAFPDVADVSVSYDVDNAELLIYVTEGTDLTSLVAEFTASDLSEVKRSGTTQESGVTTNDFTINEDYVITSPAGEEKAWGVTVLTAGANVTFFDFPDLDFTGVTIDQEANAINVLVQEGTDVSELTPTFSLSGGAVATVASVSQVSGASQNDFGSSVVYQVESLAGEVKSWTVTVKVQEARFTSFSFENIVIDEILIDNDNQTVLATVPADTDLSALVAEFSLTDGATVAIDGSPQLSGVTSNNFSSPVSYQITSAAGEIKNWEVIVSSVAANINSFDFPGLTYRTVTIDFQAQEINVFVPVGTDVTGLVADFTLSNGAAVTVGGTGQLSGTTANDFTATVNYAVTSQIGELVNWQVNVIEAGTEIVAFGFEDFTFQKIELLPEESKILAYVPQTESLSALVTTFGLSEGANAFNSGVAQISGVSDQNFNEVQTYEVISMAGDSRSWGVVTIKTNPAIVDFSFDNEAFSAAIIDDFTNTIDVFVQEETDLTRLVATFALTETSEGMDINGTPVVSGVSAINYSNQVTFTTKAVDGHTEEWQINVKPTNADILSFQFNDLENYRTEIQVATNDITVYVPSGTDLGALVPTFIASPNADVYNEGVLQVSGVTASDFSSEVTFVVEAAPELMEEWTVTVIETGADILAFDLTDTEFVTTEISTEDQLVTLYVPDFLDLDRLIAEFTISDLAIAVVSGETQLSLVSENNFSRELKYVVTSFAGDSRIWSVAAVPVSAALEQVSLEDVSPSFEQINRQEQEATVYVAPGTDLTSVALQFELSADATATVEGTAITSGAIVDLSTPLQIDITGRSGHLETWTVTAMTTANDVLSFRISGVSNHAVEINDSEQLVTIYVPAGSDVTALIPGFELSPMATAFYLGQPLDSESRALDFSAPVLLNVQALNGSVRAWTVVVKEAFAAIQDFSLAGVTYQQTVIDEVNQLVTVYVSATEDLTQSTISFELSNGAALFRNGVAQQSGASIIDLSSPAMLEVRSLATNLETWQIRAVPSSADFRSFSFGNLSGVTYTIDKETHTIFCDFEVAQDVSNLVASFHLSDGAEAFVDGLLQESGITINNYSDGLVMSVQSEAGEVIDWQVIIEFPEIITSTEDISGEVTVFPVPARDYTTISLPEKAQFHSVIRLFNLNGQQMIHQEVFGQESVTLDLTSLAAQNYILVIEGKDWIVKKRISKIQ